MPKKSGSPSPPTFHSHISNLFGKYLLRYLQDTTLSIYYATNPYKWIHNYEKADLDSSPEEEIDMIYQINYSRILVNMDMIPIKSKITTSLHVHSQFDPHEVATTHP